MTAAPIRSEITNAETAISLDSRWSYVSDWANMLRNYGTTDRHGFAYAIYIVAWGLMSRRRGRPYEPKTKRGTTGCAGRDQGDEVRRQRTNERQSKDKVES